MVVDPQVPGEQHDGSAHQAAPPLLGRSRVIFITTLLKRLKNRRNQSFTIHSFVVTRIARRRAEEEGGDTLFVPE